MKKLAEFAAALRTAKAEQNRTVTSLAEGTGLTIAAVRRILAGEAAPRLTTAMAMAEQLGLELVLVPAAVAEGMRTSSAGAERTVLSDIERQLGGDPLPGTKP